MQARCSGSNCAGLIHSHAELTETLGRKRRRIGKRLLSGHHLGQQPAGRGAERQPMVLMTEIEPQPGVPRGRADHRQHVGQTRPPPHPGLGVDRLAQGKQPPRRRQGPLGAQAAG